MGVCFVWKKRSNKNSTDYHFREYGSAISNYYFWNTCFSSLYASLFGLLDGEANYWFFILVFIAAIVLSTLIALYLNAYG